MFLKVRYGNASYLPAEEKGFVGRDPESPSCHVKGRCTTCDRVGNCMPQFTTLTFHVRLKSLRHRPLLQEEFLKACGFPQQLMATNSRKSLPRILFCAPIAFLQAVDSMQGCPVSNAWNSHLHRGLHGISRTVLKAHFKRIESLFDMFSGPKS